MPATSRASGGSSITTICWKRLSCWARCWACIGRTGGRSSRYGCVVRRRVLGGSASLHCDETRSRGRRDAENGVRATDCAMVVTSGVRFSLQDSLSIPSTCSESCIFAGLRPRYDTRSHGAPVFLIMHCARGAVESAHVSKTKHDRVLGILRPHCLPFAQDFLGNALAHRRSHRRLGLHSPSVQ